MKDGKLKVVLTGSLKLGQDVNIAISSVKGALSETEQLVLRAKIRMLFLEPERVKFTWEEI